MEDGIPPESLLLARSSSVSPVRFPISDGIVPSRLLDDNSNLMTLLPDTVTPYQPPGVEALFTGLVPQFVMKFQRSPFGAWELAGCERFSDRTDVWKVPLNRSLDGASHADSVVWLFMSRVTLPALLICAVVLGGALLWHWRKR